MYRLERSSPEDNGVLANGNETSSPRTGVTLTKASDLKPGDVFNWRNEGRKVVAIKRTRGNRLLVDMCHPLFEKDTSLAIIEVDRELDLIS